MMSSPPAMAAIHNSKPAPRSCVAAAPTNYTHTGNRVRRLSGPAAARRATDTNTTWSREMLRVSQYSAEGSCIMYNTYFVLLYCIIWLYYPCLLYTSPSPRDS